LILAPDWRTLVVRWALTGGHIQASQSNLNLGRGNNQTGRTGRGGKMATVSLTVNGKAVLADAEADTLLAEFIR
jgi:hypothetical protein